MLTGRFDVFGQERSAVAKYFLGKLSTAIGRTELFGRRDGDQGFYIVNDLRDTFVNRLDFSIDGHFWTLGRLVGCGDAGKVGDFSGARFLVEPLGIALLAGLQSRLDKNLVEGALSGGAGPVAVDLVG